MRSPRWSKVWRDLWTARGRMFIMVSAVAVSLVGVGTTLGGYAIMSREMNRAYLGTNPAAATLDTHHAVNDALVARVKELPNVLQAEARATLVGRVQVGEDWRPAMLFVVPDFNRMQLATFAPVSGAWPPPPGSMLVERMAMPVLEAEQGAQVMLKTAHNAQPVPLAVSGVAYDPGLAPATMERTVYGYITSQTLAMLGETQGLDEIKITVKEGQRNTERIEATASAVAQWLADQGHAVESISVPPPGKHPHQGQMYAVMLMLNIFSLLSVLLSGVLVANTMAALMARQIKEIGIMKTLGAQRLQVAVMYVAMVALLGTAAVLLAWQPSVLASQLLAGQAAKGLNIALSSVALPWWVLAVQLGAGLLVPLLAAAIPVSRAARMTVQQALADTGVAAETFGRGRLARALKVFANMDSQVVLGLRNAFRRPGRLAMTLGLLAFGGAMFITAADTRQAWATRLSEVNTTRHYDLEVQFRQAYAAADVTRALEGAQGIAAVETWGRAAASWGVRQGPEVHHTYPDRGHGSFMALGVPPDSSMVSFPLLSGRWLQPEDDDVVVLNHMAAAAVPQATVGSTVTITVHGEAHKWRVVGFVRDIGSPATVYLPRVTFDRSSGAPGSTQMLRVSTTAETPVARSEVLRGVMRTLEAAQINIAAAIPLAELRTAMGEHMAVLLGVIVALAFLMTLVGGLGLAASMTISVMERTRELGVMRSVGATPAAVLRVIMGEGVWVGAMSAVFACALAVPLSAGVGALIGALAFRAPLPLVVSVPAVVAWLFIVVGLSALATATPALGASRMTVRDALAYT